MLRHSTSIAARLGEVLRKRGRIPFAAFMEEALYGSGGYYTNPEASVGREADFVTAPEVSPALGATLGLLLTRLSDALQRPTGELRLLELGPGRGRLLEALLDELDRQGRVHPHVLLVERGGRLRELCREMLSRRGSSARILSSLDETKGEDPVDGVVIANELFDALAVHRVRGGPDGRLEEAWVTLDAERFVEQWGPPSTPELERHLAGLDICLAEGVEAEVNLAAPALLRQTAHLLGRGLFVILDYGYPSHILYDDEVARPTLRAFRRGGLETDVLKAPGSQDITAHVDFSALARAGLEAGLTPLCFADQASFLVGLGAHELPEAARRGLVRLVNAEEMGGTIRALVLGRDVGDTLFEAVRDRRRLLWRDQGSLPPDP